MGNWLSRQRRMDRYFTNHFKSKEDKENLFESQQSFKGLNPQQQEKTLKSISLGQISNEVLINKDERQVVQTAQYPYSAIGKIQQSSKIPYKKVLSGSGCLIGPNIVLTCAHNCFDYQNNEKYKNLYFYPGYTKEKEQTCIKIKQTYFRQQYNQKNRHYDYAIVELEECISQKFGFLGCDASQNNVNYQYDSYEIPGYPGEKQKEENQYKEGGKLKKIQNDLIGYEISTTPGQSGSPIIKKQEDQYSIVGIHTSGNKKKKTNVGVRMRQQILEDIRKWAKLIVGSITIRNDKSLQKSIGYLNEKWRTKTRNLMFQNTGLENKHIKTISENPWRKLKSLSLKSNSLSDQSIKYINSFKQLEKLNISHNSISNEGLKALKLKQLRKIIIGYNKLIINQYNPDLFNFLCDIEYMVLDGNNIDDSCFKSLKKFQDTLLVLSLEKTKITNLRYVAKFQKLKKLFIRSNELTKEGMLEISQLTNLNELCLRDSKISNEHLEQLQKGLPCIRYLHLQNNNITDEGINFLMKFKSLKELQLKKNNITYKGEQLLNKFSPFMVKQKQVSPD